MSDRYLSQSFLGLRGEEKLADVQVAIVGVGGGGSHISQQLSHIGVVRKQLVDPDRMELKNITRLIGGTFQDVVDKSKKVDIAARLAKGVDPSRAPICHAVDWQERGLQLRECDFIFGCVDSFRARDQLEIFTRRFHIPYIDIGMDVHESQQEGYIVSGQVVLSMAGLPCLRCLGIVSDDRIALQESEYGMAGSRPQVVWPNGVLASLAVGMFMQMVTPWNTRQKAASVLEFNGQTQHVSVSNRLKALEGIPCQHRLPTDVGDPFFKMPGTGGGDALAW